MSVFDTAPPAIQQNMIRDVQEMVRQEAGRSIDAEQAEQLARKLLARAKSREALYRVSTARLRSLVDALAGARHHATKKSPAQLQREIDETLASKGKTKTSADLEKALADRLGFIPTEDFILRALDEWEGFTLDSLRSEERRMTREFEKRGGRGPDLADRIDAARTALALVDSGFLLKGDLGILKRADRYRPRLKSDFDY